MSDIPFDPGLHLLLTLPGPRLGKAERSLLRELRPAGLHLLQRNFLPGEAGDSWLEALGELLAESRQLCDRPGMLVAIDHEGGQVHRLPRPFTRFPYAMHWGDQVEQVARAISRELRAIGINLLFGPVADVHSNPGNPVIGPRAFAEAPEACAERVSIFVKTVEAEGLRSCLKHFPGHGDTRQDSHDELPRLQADLETLRQRELPPFRAGIRAGASLVMSAHVAFEALDPGRPATLSPLALRTLLREELGFAGVCVSDDTDMAALAGPGDDVYEQAFRAGVDLLLFNHHPERARVCAEVLRAAVAAGRVSKEHWRASAARITALLEGLPAPVPPALPDGKLLRTHADLAESLQPKSEDYGSRFRAR